MVNDSYFGFRLDRRVPLRDPDLSRFAVEELATVEQIISALWGKNAREVSDFPHEEMG